MADNIRYQLFTIRELRDWLLHGQSNGLCDTMISRARAYAFINNPCAQDDDVVISAVWDGDRVIGYTAVFGEEFIRPQLTDRYFWGSTQWLEPEYRGQGISWKMMRDIKDAVGDRYLASDSSIASIKLDMKQGSDVYYFSRYFMKFHSDNKGIKACVKNCICRHSMKLAQAYIGQYSYTNRYINYIDDTTYRFMQEHSQHDFFFRRQEMMNWQMRYPMVQAMVADAHTEKETCEFGAYINRHEVIGVQVYVSDMMVGVYVMSLVGGTCTPLYLYYDDRFANEVFASMVGFVMARGVESFQTFHQPLYHFMQACGLRGINSKYVSDNVALTVPNGFHVDTTMALHGGDGDMY